MKFKFLTYWSCTVIEDLAQGKGKSSITACSILEKGKVWGGLRNFLSENRT